MHTKIQMYFKDCGAVIDTAEHVKHMYNALKLQMNFQIPLTLSWQVTTLTNVNLNVPVWPLEFPKAPPLSLFYSTTDSISASYTKQ